MLILTPEVEADSYMQRFEDFRMLVRIEPYIVVVPREMVQLIIRFNLFTYGEVPKPDLQIAVNANGSRYRFRPYEQTVGIYGQQDDGTVVYQLSGHFLLGTKSKKMLKDIAVTSGPVKLTYDFTLDGKSVTVSSAMPEPILQMIVKSRDLLIDTDSLSDATSYGDRMCDFRSE